MNKQNLMHGSIFVMLRKFVESNYDYSTWMDLLKKVGVERTSYPMHGMYPTDELFAIVHEVAEKMEIPVYDFMEKFGEFMVPDLIEMYKDYLDPAWCTYEMLIYTEEKMHGAVKSQDKRTSPPKLLVTKQGEKRLIINYTSKRRMSGVAVGIIRGIARYYQESDKVTVIRLSQPAAEKVQILVDFE
ncbi:heme NO-binding domain-containing protein [Adhaeribacter aquaticus]|uniref:heme NO-binding domain-containing protein n=1 Tax=Adhaeribacter aquaticus TaxID=299567 RepID=UPI00146FA489|nr:heme NO-binding domain-containing protein [Adhaeribacter aquaticus]